MAYDFRLFEGKKMSAGIPDPTDIVPMGGAQMYSTAAEIRVTPNEVVIIFIRHQPAMGKDARGIPIAVGVPVPVVQMAMSPQSAVDLHTALTEQVTRYEAEYGRLVTASRVEGKPQPT